MQTNRQLWVCGDAFAWCTAMAKAQHLPVSLHEPAHIPRCTPHIPVLCTCTYMCVSCVCVMCVCVCVCVCVCLSVCLCHSLPPPFLCLSRFKGPPQTSKDGHAVVQERTESSNITPDFSPRACKHFLVLPRSLPSLQSTEPQRLAGVVLTHLHA